MSVCWLIVRYVLICWHIFIISNGKYQLYNYPLPSSCNTCNYVRVCAYLFLWSTCIILWNFVCLTRWWARQQSVQRNSSQSMHLELAIWLSSQLLQYWQQVILIKSGFDVLVMKVISLTYLILHFFHSSLSSSLTHTYSMSLIPMIYLTWASSSAPSSGSLSPPWMNRLSMTSSSDVVDRQMGQVTSGAAIMPSPSRSTTSAQLSSRLASASWS